MPSICDEIAMPKIQLPKDWSKHIINGFIHSIAFARAAITYARGDAANSSNARLRKDAQIDYWKNEVYLEREEKLLLYARLARVPAAQRPRCTPIERLRTLALKTARGWSMRTCAKAMLLDKGTICDWMGRVRQGGESAFIQMAEPVNKFPDGIRQLVKQFKVLFPSFGKKKIAGFLTRMGLHMAVTTAGRVMKEEDTDKPKQGAGEEYEQETDAKPEGQADENERVVTSKRPNHVWHTDLTVVPTMIGFWVPWIPFSALQVWPFCWWVVAIVDHHSRRVMCLAVFTKQPSSMQVCDVLEITCSHHGVKPKHMITDKGGQFWSGDGDTEYQLWCEDKANNVKPRYGAVGKYGGLAVIERFIRTLKERCTRCIPIPFKFIAMQTELNLFMDWFNENWAHEGLNGCTPNEIYNCLPPENEKPRYEPRPLYPKSAPCAAPQTSIRGSPGVKLKLEVTYFHGRRHLPIVRLKEVA